MRFVIHFFWAGSLPPAGASNSYVLVMTYLWPGYVLVMTCYLLQTLPVAMPGHSDDQLLACTHWGPCGKSPHCSTLDIPSSTCSSVNSALCLRGLPPSPMTGPESFAEFYWESICMRHWEGISSGQFSHSVVSDFLQSHEPQHTRPPCPSPPPRVHPNPCPLSWWYHPTISSSVVPLSYFPQFIPASGSFPMSQFFTSGGQSIGVSASASVLPINTHDWFPLGWTGWISSQSKGLSRVFSKTTVLKHQFFSAQLSL